MGVLKEKKFLLKKFLIGITLFIVAILIMIIFLFNMAFGSKTNTDIEDYLNTGTRIDIHAKDMMPTLDKLPEYEEIEYRHTYRRILWFVSNSVALIIKYDDEIYEREKEKLAGNYTFLNQKINSSIPDYEFSVNSYIFKVVKGNENDNTHFPKSFGMIGTSDEKQSIAYLYFHDFDLDYIKGEDDRNPMEYFVNKYFDYNF